MQISTRIWPYIGTRRPHQNTVRVHGSRQNIGAHAQKQTRQTRPHRPDTKDQTRQTRHDGPDTTIFPPLHQNVYRIGHLILDGAFWCFLGRHVTKNPTASAKNHCRPLRIRRPTSVLFFCAASLNGGLFRVCISGVGLGSSWGHVKNILAWCWEQYGIILEQF